MLRRTTREFTSRTIRRFYSNKNPRPGFGRFIKIQENSQVPKSEKSSLTKEEVRELIDKQAVTEQSEKLTKSESHTNKECTNPPSNPYHQQKTKPLTLAEWEFMERLHENVLKQEEHRKGNRKNNQSPNPDFNFLKSPYLYIGAASLIALYYMIPQTSTKP